MGNSMRVGNCRALSLRDVYTPSQRGAKSISPLQSSEKERRKSKRFMIKDECQLDAILDEIEQTLSDSPQDEGRERKTLTTVRNNIKDACDLINTVGNYCQGLNLQIDGARLAAESRRVVGEMLGGAKNLHWAGAALALVAYALKRLDQVNRNTSESFSLLIAMRDLAKHIRVLIPQLQEQDEKLQRATELIAKGTALCCMHLRKGPLSKFGLAGTTKDDMGQLRLEIDRLYPDLHLSAVEVLLDRTKILTRQSSLPLAPLTPAYPTNKVGLDERVDVVMKKLMIEDPSVRAVILHGMGGIGKSTLGDGVHARVNFQGRTHCKIEVGEKPSLEKICALQANIMERLSGEKHRLGDHNEGRQKLGKYVQVECRDPLFIYIDNVVKADDLNLLLPEKLFLPQRSRLMITSRTTTVKEVLLDMGIEICDLYEVEELDFPQAKKLLCMQVFDKQEPPADKLIQVTEVLNACGRLPLALEVVGKYLRYHKGDNAWKYAITSLKTWDPLTGTKDNMLFQKLEFSYDQLTKSKQKAFLDITSFYLDLPWEMVNYVIGEERLVALEELALVKKKRLDFDNVARVHVHDLLVSLGRNYEDDVRIWSAGERELPSVLTDNDVGIRKVEGLCLRNCMEVLPAKSLDMLCSSLRILILEQDVEGHCEKIPTQLQLFITRGSMPFQHLHKLTHLAVLSLCEVDMDFRNVEFPRCLKALAISECHNLRELPEVFGHLHVLHALDLSLCEKLEKLPRSFGQLSALQTLDLRSCRMLKELPQNFINLKALQRLDLGGCENLAKLPIGFGQLCMLQRLMLWQCSHLGALPVDFGHLAALQELNLCGCENLTRLPETFGSLSALQTLELRSCRLLERLPEDFVHLKALQRLDLSGCEDLARLPDGFGQLSKLQSLMLCQCSHLAALPKDFGQLAALQELNLNESENLLRLPDNFGRLSGLHTLSLVGCSSLSELSDDFGSLSSLAVLKLAHCDHLALPKTFTQLCGLKFLDVEGCSDELVQSVGELVACNNINYLTEHSIRWEPSEDDFPDYEFSSSELQQDSNFE